MHRYIALLRGANVGGHNRIAMPLLRAAFAEAGLHRPLSYINSGNILFRSGEADVAALQQKCRELIADRFGLNVPVAVISAEELAEALDHAPAWWDADVDAKHNAIFLAAPGSAKTVLEADSSAWPNYERVAYHGRVIFWSAPMRTFSHDRWQQVASAAGENATIRSASTVKQLHMLAQEEPR